MWLLDVNLPTGLVTLLRGYGISCDTAAMPKRMLDSQVARFIASRRGSRTCPGIDAGS
jgi:hypothetical protein